MKAIFLPEARIEYAEAVQFYGEQRQDLGQAVINAIENALYRIREFPERWGILDGDVRRCLVHKFPYSVLYRIKQTEQEPYILIIAVMHGRREEGYWKARIGLG